MTTRPLFWLQYKIRLFSGYPDYTSA